MIDNAIQKEIQRIQEDCEYSAKGHFESARCWRRWNCLLMIISIFSVCACLVLTFADWNKLWVGGIGIFSSFLTFVLIFLNPQEKYLSHYNSGNNYLALRDKTRIFAEVERLILDEEKQIERLKQLSEQKSNLNIQSLPIMTSAYKNAKKQIQDLKTSEYSVDKNS